MSNRFFDWVAKSVSARFQTLDTVRSRDLNAALDELSAGLDKLPRGVAVCATSAAPQTIATGNTVKILLGTETYDTDAAFASSTFTCPTGGDGYYHVSADAAGNLGVGAAAILCVYKNGSLYRAGPGSGLSVSTSNVAQLFVNADVLLAAGDTVDVYVIVVSGAGSLAIASGGANLCLHQFRGTGT